MLATLGDLVNEIVVRLDGPINLASDTPARITQRRGGSAANAAAATARLGRAARFIGQVGDDPIGDALVAELTSLGVDITSVRRAGSTGTIVVVVDDTGERSMLTDRRTSIDLDDPDPSWLDGVTTLHVPFYSLVDPPLSDTARTMIDWTHSRRIAVSVDVSSVALIEGLGADAVRGLIGRLQPTVVFANEDEARALGLDAPIGTVLTVVKRGPRPAVIHRPGRDSVEVPALPLDRVADTTGAGDAFAAGFLAHDDDRRGEGPTWLRDPAAACRAGHRAAADLMAGRQPAVGG